MNLPTKFKLCNVLVALLATGPSVCGLDTSGIPPGLEGFKDRVRPFFNAHCVSCHGPEKSKGKMTVHSLDGDLSTGQELDRWEQILEVLESGEMPPEDEEQPSANERSAVAKWIDAGLRTYVKKAEKAGSGTTARRLTNFEYRNTMRDLLGPDLDYARDLPEDPDKPYHFNNTAEFMLLGPDQYDRYLEIARRAMSGVIVDPKPPEVKRIQQTFKQNDRLVMGRASDEIGVYGEMNVGSFNVDDWPAGGRFRIRIEASAILPEGHEEVPMRVIMGSHLRHDAGTGNYYPVGTTYIRNNVDESQVFEFTGQMENHPFQVGKITNKGQESSKRYVYVQNLYDNGHLNAHRRGGFDNSYQLNVPRIVIRSFEMESPVFDTWPPEHHTRILFDSPLRDSEPDAYVKQVLERFLPRAFRRPPTPDELDRFQRLYKLLAPQFSTFEEAIRETLSMVLMSPQFLYHKTPEDRATPPAYQFASRLSYFLWGSMPDEQLFALAAKDRLKEPDVLEAQVKRMLTDPRSRDFINNFTQQWLSIKKMHAVKVNQQLFPQFLYTVHIGQRSRQEVLFRPTVRDYLEQETTGFIAELVRRNAPLAEVVDADFTVLNERLANHYGIDGVKGMKMRPVSLKPTDRIGGLLTQGSVLLANGTGSAPHTIYRAVWLREAILGDKVNPPPAEVPALVDTAGEDAADAITIKDLLRLHRQKESCNDCHVRLDPWGIPFERYNAVGQYQPLVPAKGKKVPAFNESQHGNLAAYLRALKSVHSVPVDAAAKVPHGPKIDGMTELKEFLLRNRHKDIQTNVVRRLLTYAIGREPGYRDRYEIERLVIETQDKGGGFQDAILAVCKSKLLVE